MPQRRRLVHRKLGTTQLHQPYQHHQVSLTHAAIDLYRIIHRTLNMQSAMIVPFTSNLCNHSFCSWRSFFAVAVMKFMALNTSDVVWDKSGLKPKKSVWVFQVWYYVVKHGLVTLVVITILQDTATFQVPFIVSVFCSWNIATVEINSSFTYMKVKSAKCLCVLLVVLILVMVLVL